ncbi:unnamed protein product [Rotaria sp. Silwood1]|nr:unnamed protein product [Rotaria sp. Silwood1]
MMNFELLPNEILFDLFDYFNGIDLLRIFYALNTRLNFLLYQQFHRYHFNFFSSSKHQFDMVCQHHLPFIADRIVTLTLSNYDSTSKQINLFFSYIPSISQFTHLRSLNLWNIPSSRTFLKITEKFHHLYNLTHLPLKFYFKFNDQMNFQLINNNIWNFPKLTHCHFEGYIDKQWDFHLSTRFSRSLSNVYISAFKFQLNQIYQLFQYASHLKHLSIYIDSDENDEYKPIAIPTLIDLKIFNFYTSDTSKVIAFLQNLSNLHRLNINLSYNLIDGYQWEQIIRYYLSKLKIFNLNMKKKFSIDQNIQE